MNYRATKIVATLGPASSDPALLEEMIRAGVNVVRLNFSHGTAQDHIERARLVREASERAGRDVAIMADLQGPKIRVGKFAEGKVFLEPGMPFVLDAARKEAGDLQGVGLDYKELPRDVKAGAVRPPPCLLMPLLLDSSPPSLTTVCTASPRTSVTVSTISPSFSSRWSPGLTSRGSSL